MIGLVWRQQRQEREREAARRILRACRMRRSWWRVLVCVGW